MAAPAAVAFSAYTLVTVLVTVLVVLTNCLVLVVASWTDAFRDLNKYFLYSLTAADLLLGLLVTPFSIFNSLYDRWVFSSDVLCCAEAYLTALFLIAGLYSLTWINVDHYMAVKKPDRHDSIMTSTRSVCWMGFAWIAAICFCCPPLFGSFSVRKARYYEDAFVCLIDAKLQRAYFITAGILVACPPLLALCLSNAHLLTQTYRDRVHVYQRVFRDRSTRPWNYRINSVLSLVFLCCWVPWCVLRIYQAVQGEGEGEAGGQVSREVQFSLFWLGLSNSMMKFFVFLVLSREFRRGLWGVFHQDSLACSPCCISDEEFIPISTHASRL